MTVIKDQKVKHGEAIGKSGSTGNAASVYENGKLIHGIEPVYRHIHIEAATSASFGNARVDPEKYMKTKFDETTKGTHNENKITVTKFVIFSMYTKL